METSINLSGISVIVTSRNLLSVLIVTCDLWPVTCDLWKKPPGCMTPETDVKRCVKEGKMEEEKDNCSDSASLRRAGKILARTVRIPSGSRICLKHRNEMNRNDKRCSCPSSWGHSWPKYRSQTACTRSLTKWENLSKLQTWKKLVH